MKDWFDTLMLFIPFVTASGTFIQAWHVWKTGTAEGVSPVNAVIGVIASVLWFFYGWRHNLVPVLLGSSLSFIGLSLNLSFVISARIASSAR